MNIKNISSLFSEPKTGEELAKLKDGTLIFLLNDYSGREVPGQFAIVRRYNGASYDEGFSVPLTDIDGHYLTMLSPKSVCYVIPREMY